MSYNYRNLDLNIIKNTIEALVIRVENSVKNALYLYNLLYELGNFR